MSEHNDTPEREQNQASEGRQPIFLLPGAVSLLIGFMVLVQLGESFVFNTLAPDLFTIWFSFIPARAWAADGFPLGFWPLLWTPFTHAFMHAGFEHVIMNCAWLAIFGTPVARRYGAGPFLAIFLVSAMFGALAFAAGTLGQVQVLVGASGGVAGLTGAAVRFIFQPVLYAADPEGGQPVMVGRRLASLREVMMDSRARSFALLWVLLNAAVPLLPILTGTGLQIAWQAHLGGFLAGFLLVPLFERRH